MTGTHRIENAARDAIVLCALVGMLGACVGVKPTVIDRHTQLENQILGRFHRLEAELILASSVRGDESRSHQSDLHREAAEAAMRRAFNADDIARLKQEQLLGEAREAQLTLLGKPKPARRLQWVRDLVAQENHDRLVLMRRVIHLDVGLSDKDLPLVRHLFHRLVVSTARAGERVETDDGQWVSVQAPAKTAGALETQAPHTR